MCLVISTRPSPSLLINLPPLGTSNDRGAPAQPLEPLAQLVGRLAHQMAQDWAANTTRSVARSITNPAQNGLGPSHTTRTRMPSQ